MKRFGNIIVFTGGLFILATAYAQQVSTDSELLDQYLVEIESLISANDLEGARTKLAEALTANLRDESLEMVHSQLRLLESLNATTPGRATVGGALTDQDKLAATDLLDSLRVALENGEIEKVKLFTDPTPRTESLLDAVFETYAAMRIEVSPPEADEENNSFLATLEFKELTTKDGDTAYPAQVWKVHRVRVIKSNGSWQKVLW